MLNKNVLVLNKNYRPLTICNVKRAVVLVYLKKVELLETRDSKVIRSVNRQFAVPSVIRLNIFVSNHTHKVPLSKRNVLKRDRYICQYCGERKTMMTTDHVVPKIQGGKDTWTNLVCACPDCNCKKGGKTPKQAGMKLLSIPKEPKNLIMFKLLSKKIEKEWKPYIKGYLN